MLVPYLAFTEFRRSFALRQKVAIKGARDFLWLSLLVALVIVVAFIAVLANGTLVDRFSATLLGRIEGAGIPIRVMSHVDQGFDAIDRSFLTCFSEGVTNGSNRAWLRRPTCPEPLKGLAIYPYHPVEDGQGVIGLPGKDSWKPGGQSGAIRFDGWALWEKDPIWRSALAQANRAAPASDDRTGLPLTLILSRTQFAEHFNYDAYRLAIGNRLPSKYVQSIPVSIAKPDDLKHLWIEVNLGNMRELVRFDTVWVDSIAASQSLVFLMPAPTLAAIVQTGRNPDLRYFPESMGKPIDRAGEQRNRDNKNTVGTIVLRYSGKGKAGAQALEQELRPILDCFQASATVRGIDLEVKAKSPVPMAWIADCGLEQTAPASASSNDRSWEWKPNLLSGDPIAVDPDGYLVVPCRRLLSTEMQQPQNRDCLSAKSNGTAVGRIDLYTGFTAANVYALDGSSLHETKARLTSAVTVENRRMMRIEPSYDAALARFDYIDLQLHFVGTPVLIVGALIVLFAMVNSLFLVVHNRRVNYGVMLAHGMSHWRISAMLHCQLLMSTVAATVIAAVLFVLVVVGVEHLYGVSGVMAYGRAHLGVVEQGFIMFTPADTVLAAGAFAAIAVAAQLILSVVLYFMPLRPGTLPVQLQS